MKKSIKIVLWSQKQANFRNWQKKVLTRYKIHDNILSWFT